MVNINKKIFAVSLIFAVTFLLALSISKADNMVSDIYALVQCSNRDLSNRDPCPIDWIDPTVNQTCQPDCNSTACVWTECIGQTLTFMNPKEEKTTIYISFIPAFMYDFSAPDWNEIIYNCISEYGTIMQGKVNLADYWTDMSQDGGNPCSCQGTRPNGTECSFSGSPFAVGVNVCPEIALVIPENVTSISCHFDWTSTSANFKGAYWVKIEGFDIEYKTQTIPNENLKAIAEGSKTIVSLNVQIWQILFYLFEIIILIVALFGLPVLVILMIRFAIKKMGSKW